MHPTHHVDSDMLLAYAAGNLPQADAIVVASHMCLCPKCRAVVAAAEVVGGVLLDDIAPVALLGNSTEAMLARLDEPASEARVAIEPSIAPPVLRALLPKPVRDVLPHKALRWRWVSPGVKFAEILRDKTGARIGLMRAQPGAPIARHGHGGEEMTLVLSGGYRDGAASFQHGDIQLSDESVLHAPIAEQDSECLSLVMNRGPVRPTRFIAKILRHVSGF